MRRLCTLDSDRSHGEIDLGEVMRSEMPRLKAISARSQRRFIRGTRDAERPKATNAAWPTSATSGWAPVCAIEQRSKHGGQTAPDQWFDMRVVQDTGYRLLGNNDSYRLDNVIIGVCLANGCIVDLANGKTGRG